MGRGAPGRARASVARANVLTSAGCRMLVKRSFTLSGHRTSVALEAEFWAVLDAMAAKEGKALSAFVAGLDAARPSGQPLASALRLAALKSGRP